MVGLPSSSTVPRVVGPGAGEGDTGRSIPCCAQPSAEMSSAGFGESTACCSGITAVSMGSAESRCSTVMICTARPVSAKASGPIPICTRGISDCGMLWKPAGTGGLAALVCTALSPSMVSVIGWNSPHRPVGPEMFTWTASVVYRCSSRSGMSIQRSTTPVASAGQRAIVWPAIVTTS